MQEVRAVAKSRGAASLCVAGLSRHAKQRRRPSATLNWRWTSMNDDPPKPKAPKWRVTDGNHNRHIMRDNVCVATVGEGFTFAAEDVMRALAAARGESVE